VSKTSIDLDDGLVARAAAVLGTRGFKATVQRALEEVVARDARMRLAERLRCMTGLDLDKPEVMDRAWR
jgi:Arc/MetJ family transcription regulator